MRRRAFFAIPGDLTTPTGGYGYDRRLLVELASQGWDIEHVQLPDGFPTPSTDTLAVTARRLAALPDGAVVLVDGLAFGAMPDIARTEAARLRLVALVHHPLADETGLTASAVADLAATERASLAAARRVICTSRSTARRLVDAFGVGAGRLAVAPPGTDRHARAPAVGDPPLILSVGAVIPRKGHDTLLRALAGLTASHWRCRIVGALDRDPVWTAGLRVLMAELGIPDRVDLAGPVANVSAALHGADLFALPSRHEGYGMAFAEALAHGLPIVGCAAGAVPEVVPADAGLLVPVGDADALAAALGSLLDDPTRRRAMADAAWAAGRRLPSWSDTAAIVAASLERAGL